MSKSRLCLAEDRAGPERIALGAYGQVTLVTRKSPERVTDNEDGLLVQPVPDGFVLAVADGVGGLPRGQDAARILLRSIQARCAAVAADGSVREALLSSVEDAGLSIQREGWGAASTLVAAHVTQGAVQTYHVGDSNTWLVGQRGRLRYASTPHSPVGYGVEAGLIGEQEALAHADLNLVSNLVGAKDMHIELGPKLALHRFDTLILASDGVWDNIPGDALIDVIRAGPIEEAAQKLTDQCQAQMAREDEGFGKPDDLSFLLYRPRPL